jgi:hypothetical protein
VPKYLISILFIFSFSVQTFNHAFIIVDYFSNTAAYEKNCVNKARPGLHCHGKCQMMKKIGQEEKKDQQNPDRRGENRYELVISSKSFFPEIIHPVLMLNTNYPGFISSALSPGALSDLFHPPLT